MNSTCIKYVFELFMSMSIHNHENYRKNHSLKMLCVVLGLIPKRWFSRDAAHMPYASNKDADQPVYQHIMINTFVDNC